MLQIPPLGQKLPDDLPLDAADVKTIWKNIKELGIWIRQGLGVTAKAIYDKSSSIYEALTALKREFQPDKDELILRLSNKY